MLLIYLQGRQILKLKDNLREILSKKQSLSTTYGQIFEQLIPFSKKFPYDTKKFRFIGDPVDGIVFDDNKIIFCEVKLHKSQLNKRQKKIKELVRKKKVDWFEIKGE